MANTTEQALNKAREALNSCHEHPSGARYFDAGKRDAAIEAIAAALAQPSQDPVAWMTHSASGMLRGIYTGLEAAQAVGAGLEKPDVITPLYLQPSAPVAQRNAAITEFVEGYEVDTGEGIYTPTEHERFLIDDAIRTFLADQDWYTTAAPSSQKE